jgi:uncharacterized protein (DUF58 family)
MEVKELIKKVRALEIKTKGLSRNVFSGQYHSAFKGRGMAFSEVRAYQIGDEVRSIDWKVSAKLGEPHIKVFEEERELTVMLLIDVSASSVWGRTAQSKKEYMAEIAATLAFAALANKDKIGAIFFSSQVEHYIPPKKGHGHVLQIIRHLVELAPKHSQTDINTALQFLSRVQKRRATVFLLSDMLAENFDKAIQQASASHDLLALQIQDDRENELPNWGFWLLKDLETQKTRFYNGFSKNARVKFQEAYSQKNAAIQAVMRKYGVDFAKFSTDKDFVPVLSDLFKRR